MQLPGAVPDVERPSTGTRLRTATIAYAALRGGRLALLLRIGQELAGLAHPSSLALTEGTSGHLARLVPADANVATRLNGRRRPTPAVKEAFPVGPSVTASASVGRTSLGSRLGGTSASSVASITVPASSRPTVVQCTLNAPRATRAKLASCGPQP